MRLTTTLFLLLALAVFSACQNSAAGQTEEAAESVKSENVPPESPGGTAAPEVDEHGHSDNAPRIELDDAKEAFDSGEAVFIDTRSEANYVTEHIKGAINLPMDSFEARVKEVPRDKKIIVYCS